MRRREEISLHDFQLVIIDSFYDVPNQKEALDWIGKLFQFKVNAYRASYPYGILPFGGSDLVGTHWILCKKENGLQPIMGFKTIDSHRSELFRIDFPALSIVAEPHLLEQRKAIDFEMHRAKKNGFPLGYMGSWTVDPSTRKNAAISRLCRKVTSAMISMWVDHFNIQSAVTFASLRFHVEKFHAYMGLTRLTAEDGTALSDFSAYPFFGEPACASVLYRNKHSEESKQDAKDLIELWNNRIVICGENSPIKISEEDKIAA